MPCYEDGRPLEHYGELFWPQPYEVLPDFAESVSEHGITEDEIRRVMNIKPGNLDTIRPNRPDLEADSHYGTQATYAAALETNKSGIEIALRQDLSFRWRELCEKRRAWLPRCVVFHAMRLSRSALRRRREIGQT